MPRQPGGIEKAQIAGGMQAGACAIHFHVQPTQTFTQALAVMPGFKQDQCSDTYGLHVMPCLFVLCC
jgi:hypothetical protein